MIRADVSSVGRAPRQRKPSTGPQGAKLCIHVYLGHDLPQFIGLPSSRNGRPPLILVLAFSFLLLAIAWVPHLIDALFITGKPPGVSLLSAEWINTRAEGKHRQMAVFAHLLAFMVCVYVAAILLRRQLMTIYLHTVNVDEPPPILICPPIGSNIHHLAVRLIEPNVSQRIHDHISRKGPVRLSTRDPIDHGDDHAIMGRGQVSQAVRIGNLTARSVARDVWPLIRFAVDRLLYLPRYKDTPKQGATYIADAQPAKRTPLNQIYFTYKMHALQIACFFFLVSIGITYSVTADASKTQFGYILATLAFFWTAISIQWHRRQQKTLERWAEDWQYAPFGYCPILYLDRSNPPEQRWEEVVQEDFAADMRQFGLSNQRLLEIIVGFMLVGFFSFMETLK